MQLGASDAATVTGGRWTVGGAGDRGVIQKWLVGGHNNRWLQMWTTT